MSGDVAVSDTSPLIALHQIDRLDLLHDQFNEVAVPPAVAREAAPSVGALPFWVREVQAPPLPSLARHRGAGERDAIALAIHLSAGSLVIDDLQGRRIATRFGLNIVGTLGLLVRARRRGLIASVRHEMDAMIDAGLYVSTRLYQAILVAADEFG